jgi:splicing factor 3B subunit 2
VVEESIPEAITASDNALYEHFAGVFAKFRENHGQSDSAVDLDAAERSDKPEIMNDEDYIQDEDEEAATKQRISNKARKQVDKLSVAELKAAVAMPEVVEWHDVSAHHPRMLVTIKSNRNIVPVPGHWSLKREYLSSKRGIEKPQYTLPPYIAETGITEQRQAAIEKQENATLKQKQRARVQPKLGKYDIDYQTYYDAFFYRQTRPALTGYGEVYYEGKESETNLRHLKPGDISDDLREVLNMPPNAPPPWLLNMQKFGPPPSYPALKIPGLTAPPPPGGSWGYQPGQWGKPPVDSNGKLLYDLLGDDKAKQEQDGGGVERAIMKEEQADNTLWGELQPREKPEEEEEEEEEDDDDDRDDGGTGSGGPGVETSFISENDTPSGIQSAIPNDVLGRAGGRQDFTLRKTRPGTETEEDSGPRSAGQVLVERSIRAEGFFGGERAYDIGNSSRGPVLGSDRDDRGRKRKMNDVDASIDIDALEQDDRLSKEQISRRYEQETAQQSRGGWKGAAADHEDLSGLVAEENAKRRKRDDDRNARGGRGGRR